MCLQGELVWAGDQNPREYLRSAGWSTARYKTADLCASHGFEMPDEAVAPSPGTGYLTAQLGEASTTST
jgi:hypothetical protein